MLGAQQRADWAALGFLRLEADSLGGRLLRRCAAAAAALVDDDAPPPAHLQGSTSHAFPFPETEPTADGDGGASPLNELTLHDALRGSAEALLAAPRGSLRLVHSGLLATATDDDDHAAFTLRPDSANAADEAVVSYVPLGAELRGTSVLLVRFDPAAHCAAARVAVGALRAEHAPVLRTVLRRQSAEHVMADSYIPPNCPALAPLTVWQRALLCCPPPGHAYWTHGTLAAVAGRYGMDPAPYLAHLAGEPFTSPVFGREGEGVGSGNGPGTVKGSQGLAPQTTTWERPGRALPLASDDVLSAAQVEHWREKGWLVLDGVWPPELIAAAAAAAAEVLPPQVDGVIPAEADGFGQELGASQFPFSRSCFNDVALHPRILRAASQLLDDPRPRFYADVVLSKHGTDPPSGNQDLHLDFGNNTLLVPPARPETVNCILNYSANSALTDGATRFVPDGLCDLVKEPAATSSGFDHLAMSTNSEEGGPVFFSALDDSHAAVYARERAVQYTAGTVLLYRLDQLHRGSPVLPGETRWTHHLNYRREDCEWVGWKTHPMRLWRMEQQGLLPRGQSCAEFLAGLAPAQLAALGGGAVVHAPRGAGGSRL
jgi:hypothetical protein